MEWIIWHVGYDAVYSKGCRIGGYLFKLRHVLSEGISSDVYTSITELKYLLMWEIELCSTMDGHALSMTDFCIQLYTVFQMFTYILNKCGSV